MTQQQIDNLIINSISNTIDNFNKISSPYKISLFKKVKGNNWLISETNLDYQSKYTYTKSLLPNNDSLKIRIDPISQLKYKYLTNFVIKFNAKITNNDSIPRINNVTAIIFDNEYPLKVDEQIKENNVIECGLFNDDLDDETIYNAIQSSQFWIELNFNGNNSNCRLEITDLNVEISFINDLVNEKEAVYNRLEGIFDGIDLNITNLNKTLYPDNYPVITITTDEYELYRDNYINGNIKQKNTGLSNVSIDYYINDVFIDTVITNDNGNFSIPVNNINNDFIIKCVFEGNSLINGASEVKLIKVNKYKASLVLECEDTFNYTTTQKEPINFNCITELIKGYNADIIVNLKNDNTVLNSLKFNVDDSFSGSFDDYNTNTNKIEVIINNDDYYQEVIVSKDINVVYNPNINYVTPSISLVSSNNYYNDNLFFKVMNGSNIINKGTCTITINGKTKSNIPVNNNRYSIPLNTTYGVSNLDTNKSYNYKVVYNGFTDGDIIYKSVTITGTVTVNALKTKKVRFNKYNGYDTNSNDAPYRKWYTLGSGSDDLCICGNADNPIGSSSGTYKKPRPLQCSNVTTNLSNVTISKVKVIYYDSNYPYTDSLSTSNSCSVSKSDNQCKIIINGSTTTFTDKVVVGNKSFKGHSFSKSGNWSASNINNMVMRLYWGSNTNSNPGRLKVKDCMVELTYRVNQTVN